MQKNLIFNYFFVGVLKVNDENSWIRIHTKMSRIRNTDKILISYKNCLESRIINSVPDSLSIIG
jgi:hypothetical protein